MTTKREIVNKWGKLTVPARKKFDWRIFPSVKNYANMSWYSSKRPIKIINN